MARMTVIYRKPKDVAAFDRHYFEIHVPLAKRLPGLRKYEVSTGAIMALAGGGDYHLVATLHFDSLAAIRQDFASDLGKECAADRLRFAPEDAQLQMLLFEDREV